MGSYSGDSQSLDTWPKGAHRESNVKTTVCGTKISNNDNKKAGNSNRSILATLKQKYIPVVRNIVASEGRVVTPNPKPIQGEQILKAVS